MENTENVQPVAAPILKPNKVKKLYLTKVEPKEETKTQLMGWRKPNHAYILFEIRQINLDSDMEKTLGTGLLTLNVEHRPEQISKIEYYMRKGGRIIDWGHFPKTNDTNTARRRKAVMHSGSNGVNPWDSLEARCQQASQQNPNWAEEKQQIAASHEAERQSLETKLADAERALEKARLNNKPQGKK